MNKLLPCPFCGSRAVMHEYHGAFNASCEDEHCNLIYQSEEEAIKAWNTRAQLDEALNVIEDGIFNAKCVISNMEEMSPHGFSTTEEEEWIKEAQDFIKGVRG